MYNPDVFSSIFGLITLGLFLIPAIFFLLTLQNTLRAISPENRRMPPSNVWLLFIPLFNLVWQFIVVDRISQSIGAECARLNIPVTDPKPTYSIGLEYLQLPRIYSFFGWHCIPGNFYYLLG